MVETERLRLRPYTFEDAPFILRLLNEPSFIENIVDKGVRTLAQAEDYLRGGPMAMQAARGHSLWCVELKDGTPIGMCGLIKRDAFQDTDIGYAFLPEHTGRGYALEALQATLAFGRTLGLTRIIALVTPGNLRSERLLAKAGFTFTEFVKMEPDPADVSLFTLILP
jgi:[ribosomal protein S5]-alanine N-acetyltransferase